MRVGFQVIPNVSGMTGTALTTFVIMAAQELRLKETLDGPRLFRPCARKPFLQRPAFQASGARQPDERSCLWDDRRSGHRNLSRRISGATVFVLLGRLQSQIRS